MAKTTSIKDVVELFTEAQCEEALKIIRIKLKKYDEGLKESLRRKLIGRIVGDLEDDEKSTPGLYQAALRLLGEETIDLKTMTPGSEVERLKAQLPFK